MTKLRTPTPDDYAERDKQVLRFVYRKKAALSDALSAVLFDGKSCGHVLRRLDGKWLELHQRGLPGNISYVTVTKKGLEHIGVEGEKPRKLSHTVLSQAVALNWHCALEDDKRFSLLPSEVEEAFGKPSHVPHVLSPDEFGRPVVFRVYFATGKLKTARKNAVEFFDAVSRKKRFGPAVANGEYGLLCLAPTREKVSQLHDAIEEAGLYSEGPLVVGLGPTDETIAKYLRERRNGDE